VSGEMLIGAPEQMKKSLNQFFFFLLQFSTEIIPKYSSLVFTLMQQLRVCDEV
jgi:hypothetical protein